MAFTQQNVDDLTAAVVAAGLSSRVGYRDGTSIQYIDRADAMVLLATMKADVAEAAAATATTKPIRAFRVNMNSGY